MRLIDEDKLIARFKQLKGSDTLANMFVSDVIKVIKEITTEYDVDKVVEQLEKYRLNFESRGILPLVNMDYAVEVVRNGGKEQICRK